MSETGRDLPASVRAYLTEPAVRTGVDALLAVEADALPDGLEWHEFADYIAARAAAELTRSEWAVAIHRLWRRVWGGIEADGWRSAPFDELVEQDYAVTPATCWEEQRFSLWHVRGAVTLYTAVRVTRSTFQVAYSLETRKVLVQSDDEHFAWTHKGEWPGWMVATLRRSPADPAFSDDELQALASTAMDRIREAAPR